MGSYSLGPVLIALGLGILVGPFVVLFFLSIGPLGWVFLGGSITGVGILVTLWGDTHTGRSDCRNRRKWTNCDNCGARIDADASTCVRCRADQ